MNKNFLSGLAIGLTLFTFFLAIVVAFQGGYSESATKVYTVNIKLDSANKPRSVAIPFAPNTLFIHKGDTVTWTNHDIANHSVVAVGFNSGVIWPNGSNRGPSIFNHVFDREGTFVYIDELHPYMGGVIYVDVPVTQRELISTTSSIVKTNIEMPQNAAYMNNYGPFFIPANAQVPIGTVLTWTNKDYVAHTATSGDGSSFDTKTILPDQSVSITIHNKGVFPYFCKIHPWMLGTITAS